MADFRRVVTALAVVVLLMGFAQTVSAQPFQCTATAAVPPTLRSEGVTELTGDIVLTCSGVPTAPAGSLANFQVFFNAPVTSRIIGTASESLLIIDENIATAQAGTVVGNSLSFLAVPVIPAGTTRNFRITNIRVNASAVASGVAGLPGTVQALVGVSGPTSLPLLNPQLTVGLVSPGLQFDLLGTSSGTGSSAIGSAGLSLQQCISVSRTTPQGFLRFKELFATAFKTRVDPGGQTTPGVIFNTESGLVVGTAGLADFGTRLRATFANVPAGVTIWVSVNNVSNTSVVATGNSLAVLASADGTPIAATETSPVPMAPLTNVGGTATAIWQITATDPFALEDLFFQVSLATSANAATNTPAAGVQGTVAGSFFPISTVPTASATAPIPRFIDSGVARNFVIFNICRTILLFPFVTNQAGFDTGLAIANTSQDTLGTAAQAGTCTWNFFGANAPAAVTTASVAAGTTITQLASTSAPNFQGYAIAVCNFQYAHGFAFVSDLGARNLAMGYLALVIPDRTRVASPAAGAASNTGESLSQ